MEAGSTGQGNIVYMPSPIAKDVLNKQYDVYFTGWIIDVPLNILNLYIHTLVSQVGMQNFTTSAIIPFAEAGKPEAWFSASLGEGQ